MSYKAPLFITPFADERVEEVNSLRCIQAEDFTTDDVTASPAVIVRSWDGARELIWKIKQDSRESVYLKPLFIWRSEKRPPCGMDQLCDGLITAEKSEEYVLRNREKIDMINSNIQVLTPISRQSQDMQFELELKIIRHMYTRKDDLEPVLCSESLFAYTFPLISAFMGKDDAQEFVLLQFLAKREIIKPAFLDRIHSCPTCSSSFLNFREICPHCASAHIHREDLVHHYRCAYEGPESDFYGDTGLVCPKCHKELKNIGVDYDRPSDIYNCHSCRSVFQEPDIDITCANCHTRSTPAEIQVREINRFSLTPLGMNSAVKGLLFSLEDDLRGTIDIVDMPTFKKIATIEAARIKRYRVSRSTLCRLRIANYIEVFSSVHEELSRINREIGTALNNTLRTSDAVTFLNNSDMLILLTETTAEWAQQAMHRVEDALNDLISANSDTPPQIQTNTHEIDTSFSLITYLHELNAK
ncbi:MAG: hypothetical protein ACQEQV_08310 [Fibrobacterota bacterium]